MTRIDQVKADYDDCKLSYEDALARLEALGMWENDADNLLTSIAILHDERDGAAR